MSASTFKILKQCLQCGNMFEAQKITTAYCSHRCNSKHYKLKLKLSKKAEAEKELVQPTAFTPKATALNKAMIKDKEFLTVNDVAALFTCSRKTVYAMIKAGKIKATNLNERKTIIRRTDIDKLFE